MFGNLPELIFHWLDKDFILKEVRPIFPVRPNPFPQRLNEVGYNPEVLLAKTELDTGTDNSSRNLGKTSVIPKAEVVIFLNLD